MLLFALVCLCVCVRASPSRRIIGGELADIRFFQSAAFVYHAAHSTEDNENFAIGCGSTIITPRLVVTAAHCLELNTIEIILHVGTSSAYDGEQIEMKDKVIHNGYDPTWHTNDTGLIFTKTPIRYGENVKPAIINKSYKSFNSATISGWGKVNKDGDGLSLDLRYLPIPFVPTSQCLASLDINMDGKICAGYGTWEKATAEGDSGSGLMVDGTIVVGLLNGDMWQEPNIDIYANLTYHYRWIQNTAKTFGVTYGLRR